MGGSFHWGEPSTNRERINEWAGGSWRNPDGRIAQAAQVAQQVIALAWKRDEEGKGEGRRKEEGGRRREEKEEGRRREE